MDDKSAWRTRESLLQRVKNKSDEKSWEEFVHYYRPFIYNVVRGMNLRHHDAEEIVQTVLIKAWNKLSEFEYDRGRGRFRGWLCQVTGNSVRDFIRKKKASIERAAAMDADDHRDFRPMELPEIERIAEREWKSYISRLAWDNISKTFKPHVAEAFLMSIRNVAKVEIVKKLGIAESSVYVYKSRVQKKLRSEIIRLNRMLG